MLTAVQIAEQLRSIADEVEDLEDEATSADVSFRHVEATLDLLATSLNEMKEEIAAANEDELSQSDKDEIEEEEEDE